MDAKVRELLNKVKEGALTYGKAASRFAQDTAEKARINLQIFDLNTEIDVAYKEIGKLVYAMHAGDEVCNEAVQSQIEAIDSKNVQLTELRGRLAAFKAAPAAEEKAAPAAEEACECAAEKAEEACECAAEKVEEACECAAEKAEEACECAAEKVEEACCEAKEACCEEKAEEPAEKPCCCEAKPE